MTKATKATKAKDTNTIKTPSSLALVRRLSPSDALMHAGRWADLYKEEGWTPIAITEKSVRGTISNRLPVKDASDPAKMKHKIEAANLQRIDSAALPIDCDTLRLKFTLRVLPGVAEPSSCTDQGYEKRFASVVADYIEREGMRELARRYAHNIASGRFLWRNRVGYENLIVRVSEGAENEWVFSDHEFKPGEFATGDTRELDLVIAEALAGDKSCLLEIEAYVQIGNGQPVFPSQELKLDAKKDKSEKGTVLYSVNDIAAMHSQKIGNAIRSIDTWHGDADAGAIAVEPYGSVTSKGVALRSSGHCGGGMDFYTLLDNWMTKDKVPDLDQQHYVMAMLVRGGVFGEKSE